MRDKVYEYDVALSFAGENRNYVEEVANYLKFLGIKVFYDVFEEANLWGKNLYEYLSEVYRDKAKYTVIFISKFYDKKLWTNHERASMQARAFEESKEYILPARFDDTQIPGMLQTIGYINLNTKSPKQFADLIGYKINSEKKSGEEMLIKPSKITNVKPLLFLAKLVTNEGNAVTQARVILMAKNSTYQEGVTDENGYVCFVAKPDRTYTLLVSHYAFFSQVIKEVDPKMEFELTLVHKSKSGSIILKKSGEIPGINGKIEIYRKRNRSIYMFADNLAIEGGADQPFNFELNTPVILEDNQGKTVHLVLKFLQGSIALLDFHKS